MKFVIPFQTASDPPEQELGKITLVDYVQYVVPSSNGSPLP